MRNLETFEIEAVSGGDTGTSALGGAAVTVCLVLLAPASAPVAIVGLIALGVYAKILSNEGLQAFDVNLKTHWLRFNGPGHPIGPDFAVQKFCVPAFL